MAEKNLVNETLLQIQNLEEVINENAKEILASTMKEEISELVKESMKDGTDEEIEMKEAEEDFEDLEDSEDESEEEESEEELEDEGFEEDEMDDMMDIEMDMDDEESMDMEMGMDDESINDLTGETDLNKVFNVFKNMKNSDTVTVVPDGDYTKISDNDEDVEYLIQMESEEEEVKGKPGVNMEEESEMYEDADYESDEPMEGESEMDEVIYELEMDLPEADEEDFELEETYEDNESYHPMTESKKAKKMETKEGMKAKVGKGAKLGSPKFTYKKQSGGFSEKKKQGKTVGLGKGPKFEFKEGEMMDMPSPKGTTKLSKAEAKEAARTYGFGSKSGRGLRKAVTPNRNFEYGKNVAESVEAMEELQMLRAKNEEYRKALNLFRDKLNEVAIFNSNLAYATRLFTEHSTSKQEKINILRRFDSAETLKESKALYKTIKDELSQGTKSTPITESIERVIEREPQSGSAVNLIESKTYENPQFLRMKDIMSKIVK
jgi:hypothetical protein